MNLRRQRPHDSLDMLLDTMCNTFGGIILLAVLVTLLTSHERHGRTAAGSDELLERRLALAQTNLNQSLRLQASLQAKADDPRWKTQVSLLATRQQIQDELKTTRELAAQNANELDRAVSASPAERLKSLNAQLAAVQARKLELENRFAASRDNTNRLNTRLIALEKQATNLVNDSQRQVRLPKEHDTAKRVVYLIARYGRLYPCRNADLTRNETDLAWGWLLMCETAEPRPAKGLDPVRDAAALTAYFRNVSQHSVYIGFCVFEDSFPAFIRARQLATETGLAYGWEPYLFTDAPVSFSPVGHAPKPQ